MSLNRNSNVAIYGRPVEQAKAGVVHDLGNLIQIAVSALNRISWDSGVSIAPALEPVIASARTALDQAGALVRETIGEAQESDRENEYASVSACLTEVETLIRCAWDNIHLEVRVGPDLPSVKCDRLSLQAAVLNLVLNAHDAMPEGGPISIDAMATLQGSKETLIELRVADSGIEMAQETMAHPFDPLFTTKVTDLGSIGLPTVKRFADKFGGSVDVENTLGAGTTVILRLPTARRVDR
ncbi:ATP-binding protein [Phyllobacterium salinisoli]|uniref:histidine kinase n=2 Tax=Phyllobacterium salinisoli TaxID=1899321 RepID=A0A368JXT2_9HYPH|nr:ATP-binding protein [Phyllobacterium salinisoli]